MVEVLLREGKAMPLYIYTSTAASFDEKNDNWSVLRRRHEQD
jgi:hypothetical protein